MRISTTPKKRKVLLMIWPKGLFSSYSLDNFFYFKQGFDIDLSNLWKYSSQELHTFITLYEKHSEKLRKHFIGILKIFLYFFLKMKIITFFIFFLIKKSMRKAPYWRRNSQCWKPRKIKLQPKNSNSSYKLIIYALS